MSQAFIGGAGPCAPGGAGPCAPGGAGPCAGERYPALLLAASLCAITACTGSGKPAPQPLDVGASLASRSVQIDRDGGSLWVVNTESDSISQIDLAARTLVREVPLGASPPAVDPVTHRFDPAERPRSLAIAQNGWIYVACQSANRVVAVDEISGVVVARVPVPDPVAVVAAPAGRGLPFDVAAISHEAGLASLLAGAQVLVTAPVGEHPWGASLSPSGSELFVTSFLRNPGVTIVGTPALADPTFIPVPDQPSDPSGNKLIPSGQARGLYAVVQQPGTADLWVPHLLLATGTPQPSLDFESTAFATFTLLNPDPSVDAGTLDQRLLFQSASLAGTFPGAFTNVVSGPRDIAFTPDGRLALVADAQSEDVLVFDAVARVEVQLVRPIPSTLLEGITIDSGGTEAYVQGRNSHDVTFLRIDEGAFDAGLPPVQVDGPPVDCLAGPDPMPADYRLGQRLFYSSNSAQFPLTQNFWMACSSCHLEGSTDAVTWKFTEGPRDTPSNAGGPINTGFLFRQAVRNSVIDYDQTIRVEQGGVFSRIDPSHLPELQSLADFTNFAVPIPQNPAFDADAGLTASQAHGQALFKSAGCAGCHSGPFFSDSAFGNPQLDLGGTVVLHDMTGFTCDTSSSFPDQPATDIDGGPRAACAFDTPTLCGVFATAPYFHDGSAASMSDAVSVMARVAGFELEGGDLGDLTAYVGSLGLGSVIDDGDGGTLEACACQPKGAFCAQNGGLGCCNGCSDAGVCR